MKYKLIVKKFIINFIDKIGPNNPEDLLSSSLNQDLAKNILNINKKRKTEIFKIQPDSNYILMKY